MQTFIKITVADAQAPSITRPSAAMMLTMNDKLAPAFYGEEFQLTVPSLCREIQIHVLMFYTVFGRSREQMFLGVTEWR